MSENPDDIVALGGFGRPITRAEYDRRLAEARAWSGADGRQPKPLDHWGGLIPMLIAARHGDLDAIATREHMRRERLRREGLQLN